MFRINKLVISIILITAFQAKLTAQTTGPSQPEVQSFQPVSISKMVETSTGEFQYSIPLFTIGGYPININYNSRVGMENEATMVGLGFNLNCGAITRQVRGLPDDFDADLIVKKINMKTNKTVGVDLGTSIELVGLSKKFGLSFNSTAGVFYNNYSGYGIESGVGTGFHGGSGGLSANAGIGINSNSQHGTGINPYFGFSVQLQKNKDKAANEEEEEAKKSKNDFFKIKSVSSNYSFNSTSYTPKIDFPFRTITTDFSAKLGFAGFYTELGGEVKGYQITQDLARKVIYNQGYGFLYAEKGKNNDYALMDFNRENEGIMTEDKPNLPFSYATPDIYSVAGQGIGGEFEIKRNNVFIGFDPKTSTNNFSSGLETEVGAGTGIHLGAESRFGYVLNTSEKWKSVSNLLLNSIDFISVKKPSSIFNTTIAEQAYFKNPADVMFNNHPVFTFSQFLPIAPTLRNIYYAGGMTKGTKIKVANIDRSIVATDFVNQRRDNRLDVIYYLTANDASLVGVQKNIPVYNFLNVFTPASLNSISRTDINRKGSHLSEMICLKGDGTRYVFNVPAYNIEKKEISFAINEENYLQNHQTTFSPDLSSVSNAGKGKDEFVSVTETPGYAHSFLLGSVLSPNYIDVDDNGPSVNDIGDYVKFNYCRLYTDYAWKSNNDKNSAPADIGNLADKRDGRAYYSEGKKEIWYIHSIESKNEVSRFYYSDRDDANDLYNTGQKLKKLDSILVFSRPELQTANPFPFKRIYFDYDLSYPLCKGANNNTTLGKLTLNAVYFKDGTSNKGKHSAYKFGYSSNNPGYNTLATDRWGNFKPDAGSQSGLNLDNKYFPFVNQESKTNADKYASSWLLNKISLPSGGTISINYEAHDYSFVQNKKAMYMTKVVGLSEHKPTSLTTNNLLYSNNTSNNYIIFKLKNNIPIAVGNPDADEMVRQDYFTDSRDGIYGYIISRGGALDASNLYGKFRVTLNPDYGEEDIPVFLSAVECGAFQSSGSGDFDYGYVKMDNTNTEGLLHTNANQISKFAWQFVKNSYPNILFGMTENPSLSGVLTPEAIASMLSPAANTVKSILQTGPYELLKHKNVAHTASLNESYIRLYIPDGFKFGGNGARVKSIEISDNWQVMTNNSANSSNYTINYDYTKEVSGKKISSGVAAYEPETGGEENPWKQPIFYAGKNTLMPDDNNFLMTPIGESLFPAANITYSEVKTTQNPVTSTTQVGSGYSKNEYYTYYDFPCQVSSSDIELVRKPKWSFNLFKNISNDYMASTQGYLVITNDMQGKPKSESSYGENGSLVSSKYYKYKTNITNKTNKLENYVNAVNIDGRIVNQPLGVETQVYGDARRFNTLSFSGSVHGNLDIQTYGPVPTFVPSVWPDFAFEDKTFSSFTLTKHIRQQGILDSVIVTDKGSTVYTKNELWDIKTGAVLLTSTINEFKAPVYNFTYPAHWAYSGMGMASDNISTEYASTTTGILPPDFKNVLHEGDIFSANGLKYIVRASFPVLQYQPVYYPFAPLDFSNSPTLKIISSGKKNLATTPIGNFTSLVYPVNNGFLSVSSATKVIDAGATEFTNKTQQAQCDSCGELQLINRTYLLSSLKAHTPWQALATYKFVDSRKQTNINADLRRDGYITNFNPFWSNNSWLKTSNAKWQFTQKTTIIDPKTRMVESVNPLAIFNSTQPSNFSGLINATAVNARYHENFFESFEDVVPACDANHFNVPLAGTNMLDNTTAHTGYFSMKTGNSSYTTTYIQDGLVFSQKFPEEQLTNCSNKLTLLPGKKYILSAWVKEQNASNITLDYANAKVDLGFTNNNATYSLKPEGQIIDGWQRIEQEFTMPANMNGIRLTFSAQSNFDDIRIFPADGNMKAYVYSYRDHSLMALLDENNFATFYEYDQQKQLKRVKKETEKGIVTIQEVNFGPFKQ